MVRRGRQSSSGKNGPLLEPQRIRTAVISIQHAEPSKATRCKEATSYTGKGEVASSMVEMNDMIAEKFVDRTLATIMLKILAMQP